MAHQPTLAHRQQNLHDRILQKVRNAYSQASSNDDAVELFARCLVSAKEDHHEVQERVTTIEDKLRQRPIRSLSPRDSDNGPATSESSKLDAIMDGIDDLQERFKHLRERFKQAEGRDKNILQKIEHIEEIAAEWESEKLDRAGSANADLDEVDVRLTTAIAEVEKTQAAVELESTEKLKTMFKEFRTEVQEDFHNIWAARHRNTMVNRLYEMVTPVAARNQDAMGRVTFKISDSPPRSVKYYWKMHDPENHNKLIAEHKFYNIKHWHWACRLEGNTDSDDDELVGSDPFTIEEAVERYPKRAVRALFSVLGLEYSRFQEQVLRDQSRREQHTTQVEKRTFEGLATERPSWKKRNSSLGSTIEPLTQRRSSSSLGSTTEPLTEET